MTGRDLTASRCRLRTVQRRRRYSGQVAAAQQQRADRRTAPPTQAHMTSSPAGTQRQGAARPRRTRRPRGCCSGRPTVGPKRPTSGARPSTVGSTMNANTSRPMIATIWVRTSAPMQTPRAPRNAATARLRHRTSSRSANPTWSRPRREDDRADDHERDRDREREHRAGDRVGEHLRREQLRRRGAASTVPVIVRWRHSPAIPITPSRRMNREVKSAVKSSGRRPR